MSDIRLINHDGSNSEDVLKEIEEAFFDIPFENSAFQTEAFVIANQMTPERAYRAIGLRMHKKLTAIREYLLDKESTQVDIDELESKIADPNTNQFDRRRHEIDIKKKKVNFTFSEKLLNDAVVELNVLYKHFKALPKYTRQQFEQGEHRHFLERNSRQAENISGGGEALLNMLTDINAIANFENNYLSCPEEKRTELLQDITTKSLFNLKSSENTTKLLK